MLGWSAREVGIVFGIQGALMVIFQGGLLGPLVKLLGEWRVLRLAIIGLLLGLLSASRANTMHSMVGSIFLAMTGATLCIPMLNTPISFSTTREYRGRMMEITSSAASWGRVLGPLMAGTSLGLLGYSGAWLVSATVVSIYLILSFVVSARRPPLSVKDDVQFEP